MTSFRHRSRASFGRRFRFSTPFCRILPSRGRSKAANLAQIGDRTARQISDRCGAWSPFSRSASRPTRCSSRRRSDRSQYSRNALIRQSSARTRKRAASDPSTTVEAVEAWWIPSQPCLLLCGTLPSRFVSISRKNKHGGGRSGAAPLEPADLLARDLLHSIHDRPPLLYLLSIHATVARRSSAAQPGWILEDTSGRSRALRPRQGRRPSG